MRKCETCGQYNIPEHEPFKQCHSCYLNWAKAKRGEVSVGFDDVEDAYLDGIMRDAISDFERSLDGGKKVSA